MHSSPYLVLRYLPRQLLTDNLGRVTNKNLTFEGFCFCEIFLGGKHLLNILYFPIASQWGIHCTLIHAAPGSQVLATRLSLFW